MIRSSLSTLTVAIFISSSATSFAAHVAVGLDKADGQLGDALAFYNESDQVVQAAETIFFPTLTSSGVRAGLWTTRSDTYYALPGSPNLSLYVLADQTRALASAATESNPTIGPLLPFAFGTAYESKSIYGAGTGSFIDMHIAGVSGPEGGQFRFWESGATAATSGWDIGLGPVNGGSFPLTESRVPLGLEGTEATIPNVTGENPPLDPFGHVHGRNYTFNKPGEYTVTFLVKDRYQKQADSAPYTVTYSVVPEPAAVGFLIIGASLLGLRRYRRSIEIISRD
ncbi:MAG TPA: hypothetical protein VF614_00620 [Chthoniobacteraceae bacterium]|jgi:hypothetical protein